MNRFMASLTITVATIANLTVTPMGSALADGTVWTVSSGDAKPARDVSFVAADNSFSFTSSSHGVILTCGQTAMFWHALVGTQLPSNHLIKMQGTQATFTGCKLTGANTPVNLDGAETWTLAGVASEGISSSILTFAHISLTITATSGWLCSFKLHGSSLMQYVNPSREASVYPGRYGLTVTEVQGCSATGDDIMSGDRWQFTGLSLTASAKNGSQLDPLNISSP